VATYGEDIFVHLRQYEVEKDEKTGTKGFYPTKVGVTLIPSRFETLTTHEEEINSAVAEMRKYYKKPVDVKLHLGGGFYCTIKSGFDCVNIRKYFVPPGQKEPIPTKKGLALKFNEWKVLTQLIEDIKSIAPELAEATPCYGRDDHANQEGMWTCTECCPFGNKFDCM